MALEFKDYYAILGVPRTASEDEIKKAFRKLARVHHPDVSRDKKGSEEKFKEINEAYEVLGNPENRRKYDTLGADWKRGAAAQPPPGFNAGGRRSRGASGGQEFNFGGTGFSDFFEHFFSQSGRPGRSGRGFPGGFDRYDGDDAATGTKALRDVLEAHLLTKDIPAEHKGMRGRIWRAKLNQERHKRQMQGMKERLAEMRAARKASK